MNTQALAEWAEILGGVVAAGTIFAWFLRPRQPPEVTNAHREPDVTKVKEVPSASLDKAIDKLANTALVAPSLYVATKTVSQIVKDRFSDHALDALAANTSRIADPVTGHLIGAGAEIASGTHGHTVADAGAHGDLATHAADHHDTLVDIVAGITGVLG